MAAGKSLRMGGIDKTFAPLLGLPLIAHTVDAFESCSLVSVLVLVLAEGNLEQGEALVKERGWCKVIAVCPGGKRRQDSVKLGLNRLPHCSWVLIHDGARPCVEQELIYRGLEAAKETGAAVAALPVKDTVKVVTDQGLVMDTPFRKSLWAVQTPQVFRGDIIREAYRQARKTVTDDAALVEDLGYRVRVYQGSYSNIKVTTPEDLLMVQAIFGAGMVQSSL